MKCTMSVECCETDASYDSKSNDIKDNGSNEGGDGAQVQHDDGKLQEMGEALEIAESRCNTLKEQLDQMRHLYREQSNLKNPGPDSIGLEFKPAVMRQNSEAITTDNSGAAVLTINNILNGITNSINRLSELHTYIEPEQPSTSRKKSKHTKTQENEFVCETHNPRCSTSRSSSWIFNDKKKDPKRKSKRVKPIYESGSMTQIKKPALRTRMATPIEEASTTSVKARRKNKRMSKFPKKIAPKRAGFNNNLSSNHLVEIYHNAAVDYADSEEMLHAEHAFDPLNHMRPIHPESIKKYHRKQVQMPTISTTDCKENDDSHVPVRNDGYRSLSPIKEQETNLDVLQHQENHFQPRFYCSRSYQSPTISSRMKQVARSYFRHFSCKSIPFCAAKSTSPSHNIGINIQQVMSIINGRQHTQGISPTLAHNIGLAAERLNNDSFTALVSTFGSRYRCNPSGTCPMQCNVNYQHLQEMAVDVPNEDNAGDDARSDLQNNKIEIEIANRKSQDTLCWSIDPNSHNNCSCANPTGLGFQQVVDKYQNFSQPGGCDHTEYTQDSSYTMQQNMYAYKVQRQANKKYSHIRSVYAQYNDTNRRCKKGMYSELPPDDGNSLPMHGKEKVLKAVLMNIHDEFSSLSEKYDELSKIVEDEGHSNSDNVEKMETLEKKLNEKEMEIQMVMSMYAEVVNLKAQLKALKDKLGMSTDILETQKRRMKLYQRGQRKQYQAQFQQHPQQQYVYCNNGTDMSGDQLKNQKTRESNTNANLHLAKLLRHIQSYREVCKVDGK